MGVFIFQRAGIRQQVFNISNLPALVSKIPATNRGGTGRAATSSARVGAGATKTNPRHHLIPSPDAALGDGVFAARKPPPLFAIRIMPLILTSNFRFKILVEAKLEMATRLQQFF